MDSKMIKILAIDDIEDNLISLKAMIKDAFPEASFFSALNGKDGLETAAAEDPDLILLDIVMPFMDGFEVCIRLKNDVKLRDIPVVFVTALKEDRESRIRALEVGAEAFLTKPVDVTELIAQIRAMVKIKQANTFRRDEKNRLAALVEEKTSQLKQELEERKRIGEALKASEERFRALFENQIEAYALHEMIFDNQGKPIDYKFMEVNQAFLDMTGLKSKDDILGKTVMEVWPNTDLYWVEAYGEITMNLKAKTFEHFSTSLGKYFLVSAYSSEKGFFATSFIDISDRVLAEKELKESEERFRALHNASFGGIAIHDKGTIINCNKGLSELTGYSMEELLGMDGLLLIASDFRELVREKILAGDENPYEALCLRKDGTIVPVRIEGKNIPYNGQMVRVTEFRDIADQKLAQDVIEQTAKYYKSLIEKAPDGIVLIGTDGHMSYASPSAKMMFGYEDDNSFFPDPNDNTHPDDLPMVLNVLGKVIQDPSFIPTIEYRFKAKEGHYRWVESTFSNQYAEPGIQSIIINFRDVTDRKRAEDLLAESAEKHRSLIEQMQEGLLVVDNNDIIEFVNPMFCKMLGYDEKELLGKVGYEMLLHESERDLIIEKNLIRQKGISEQYELAMIRKTGEQIVLFMNASPVQNSDGLVVGSMSTCIDITERKQSEVIQQIQYSIARSILSAGSLEELLEVVRDEVSKLLDVTNFMVALYHPERDTLSKIIYKDEQDDFSEWPAANSISGQVIKSGKTIFMNRDEIEAFAREKELSFIGTPAACWLGVPITSHDQPIGTIVIQSYKDTNAYNAADVGLLEMVAHEVSIFMERRKLIEDLIEAKNAAEESDRLKTAFINNISHEIRTPLNGIIGFGQFMVDPGLSHQERMAYYNTLENSSQRLMQTVTDYIDISMIATATMKASPKEFLLQGLMNELLDFVKLRCTGKNIVVGLDVPGDAKSLAIVSDRELLLKAIRHLLDNASKFTREGRINFGYVIKNECVEFFVKDTGLGIARDKWNVIFDPWVQEESDMTRGHEGSGLGLSITKGIIESIGGQIRFESEKGVGSTFFFDIPGCIVRKKEEQPKVTTLKTIASENPLILIAEDDESSFLFMEIVLRKNGFRTLHAFNGAEAVDMCLKHPEIEVVLMDIKMPVMNGLDATQLIKDTFPDLPVIAVTAHAQAGDEFRILQAGCDAYISKPMNKHALLELILQYT